MHQNHLKTLNFETQLSLDLSCIWDWWKGSEGKEQDADFTHHMMDNISILVPSIIFLDIVAHDINVLEDRSVLRERYFSILAYQAEKVLNFPQNVHLVSPFFFFNLSNQFGSYSISDHDDEFNITTKKTRMVHMHTLLNFQL